MDKGSATKVIHSVFVAETETSYDDVERGRGREWQEVHETCQEATMRTANGGLLRDEDSFEGLFDLIRRIRKAHERAAVNKLRIRRLREGQRRHVQEDGRMRRQDPTEDAKLIGPSLDDNVSVLEP
jgi:hypothetical protein